MVLQSPAVFKSICCVKDCAELNIRSSKTLLGDTYISQDMKQNLMLVAGDNRKMSKKDLSKSLLKNPKAFDDEKNFD